MEAAVQMTKQPSVNASSDLYKLQGMTAAGLHINSTLV